MDQQGRCKNQSKRVNCFDLQPSTNSMAIVQQYLQYSRQYYENSQASLRRKAGNFYGGQLPKPQRRFNDNSEDYDMLIYYLRITFGIWEYNFWYLGICFLGDTEVHSATSAAIHPSPHRYINKEIM